MLFPLAGGSGAVIKLGELVMILDLHRQGLSVSAIARHLCIDRKTVRSAIAKGLEPPKYKTRPPRARITDPFEPYLKERLAAYPGLTAVRLWREAKERGYAGGCSSLRDCVRDLRPPRTAGFEVRFETPPGQQAQVDFAHFEVEFADEPGVSCFPWCLASPGLSGAASSFTRTCRASCAVISPLSRRSAARRTRSYTIG